MTVKLINRGDVGEFVLEGRLDGLSSPEVQNIILEACDRFKKIVLNFERLQYLSSAGLRVLKKLDSTTKAKGIDYVLTNVSEFVMEVLEMTGFAQILNIE